MANLKTISQFRSKLAGGGARPNLFEVSINDFKFASPAWDSDTFQFLCKGAQLPSSIVSSVEVPFRGRTLKVAGDRTFDNWTINVINDEDFKLRVAFEQWMNGINKLSDGSGTTSPNSYMANAVVHQLGRGYNTGRNSTTNSGAGDGSAGRTDIKPLRTYYFDGIFPTNIGAIDLSYDTADTIEEYTVEFQVQYWIAGSESATGSPSDQTNVAVL